MRSLALVVLLVASTAAAAPAFHDATIAPDQVDALFGSLGERTEEPVGLVVANHSPVEIQAGLEVGDLIRAIDGRPATRNALFESGTPVIYLDVLRHGHPLVIRLAVHYPSKQEGRIERDRLREHVKMLRDGYIDQLCPPVTRGGATTGVEVRDLWLDSLEDGDIVRSVDGFAVTSATELLDLLDKASGHDHIEIGLERFGQPVTLTLHVVDAGQLYARPAILPSSAPAATTLSPALAAKLARIKKLSATSYEVPADVRDAILASPMDLARGARVVPAISNGVPDGFKLYAIRPGSLFATLGLMNGDTVEAIDGTAIVSADAALAAYAKLRGATSLTLTVKRHGQPLTLQYQVK